MKKGSVVYGKYGMSLRHRVGVLLHCLLTGHTRVEVTGDFMKGKSTCCWTCKVTHGSLSEVGYVGK